MLENIVLFNSKIRLFTKLFSTSTLGRVDLGRVKRIVPELPVLLHKMDGYHCIGALSSLKEGLQETTIEGIPYPIVILKKENMVRALNGQCPHKKGEMALGDIEDEGDNKCSIVCPRHRKRFIGGLRFDTETGQSSVKNVSGQSLEYDSSWTLQVHEVIVQEDNVFVKREPKPMFTSSRSKCDAL